MAVFGQANARTTRRQSYGQPSRQAQSAAMHSAGPGDAPSSIPRSKGHVLSPLGADRKPDQTPDRRRGPWDTSVHGARTTPLGLAGLRLSQADLNQEMERHPMPQTTTLAARFDSAGAPHDCSEGIALATDRHDHPTGRWERLRVWTAALTAVIAAILLSGTTSSLEGKCAGMSEGSWFHVEYCHPRTAVAETKASTPDISNWSRGKLALDFPVAAPRMTPVAQSLRPIR